MGTTNESRASSVRMGGLLGELKIWMDVNGKCATWVPSKGHGT